MKNNRKGMFWLSGLSTLTLTALCGTQAGAQQAPEVIGNAVANQSSYSDVSRPLAELAIEAPATQGVHQTHAPLKTKLHPSNGSSNSQVAAQALQSSAASTISATVGLSFEGVGQVGGFYSSPSGLFCPSVSGTVLAPPDTNAAVGDTQVVQWINVCYAVFDKSSGAVVAGPFAGTNFWKGFGGPCEANNDGDIIIQWDKANHRWLAAQNVFNGPPYYTCVAVSQTADTTGSYYRYAFPQPGFPDYPK